MNIGTRRMWLRRWNRIPAFICRSKAEIIFVTIILTIILSVVKFVQFVDSKHDPATVEQIAAVAAISECHANYIDTQLIDKKRIISHATLESIQLWCENNKIVEEQLKYKR